MCVRVFSVGFGPGLDSMSPARSRRSASHAAGTHGWLPQKTGRPGLRRGGVGGYNLHSVPPDSPPDCGTVAHQQRAGCIRLVHVVNVRKGILSKTLLQYTSLTLLERECYEGEVQPYRKTDYKPTIDITDPCRHII